MAIRKEALDLNGRQTSSLSGCHCRLEIQMPETKVVTFLYNLPLYFNYPFFNQNMLLKPYHKSSQHH
ncbi:hypothetical protein Hanom_Chr08g00685231 [Helianthus anomalus]